MNTEVRKFLIGQPSPSGPNSWEARPEDTKVAQAEHVGQKVHQGFLSGPVAKIRAPSEQV